MFLIVFALICCIIFIHLFLWGRNKCLHFAGTHWRQRVTSAKHIDLTYYTLTRHCYCFKKTVKSFIYRCIIRNFFNENFSGVLHMLYHSEQEWQQRMCSSEQVNKTITTTSRHTLQKYTTSCLIQSCFIENFCAVLCMQRIGVNMNTHEVDVGVNTDNKKTFVELDIQDVVVSRPVDQTDLWWRRAVGKVVMVDEQFVVIGRASGRCSTSVNVFHADWDIRWWCQSCDVDVITFSTHRLHFLYTHHHIFNYHSHAMISLHWLCVPERIVFKVATLTLRALHGTAPPYTTSQFTRVADMSNRRKLRSASSNQLDGPSFCRPTVSRVFPTAGAKVWNSLPDDVTSSLSLSTFWRHTYSAAVTTLTDTACTYSDYSGPCGGVAA